MSTRVLLAEHRRHCLGASLLVSTVRRFLFRSWLLWSGLLLAQPLAAEVRCHTRVTAVSCDFQSALTLLDLEGQKHRLLYWQVPLGEQPERGWPAVLLFHDQGVEASSMWSSVVPLEEREHHNTLAETLHPRTLRTRTIADLLDAGFAVLTPQGAAPSVGSMKAWQTNSQVWAYRFTASPDRQMMLDLLEAIASGELPFDPENLFAFGTGSGGMMASRLAIEFPGFFRAIGIQSGSYATCYGVSCTPPSELPADHAPTLFLHGRLDWVVPLWSMELYAERLERAGVETRLVIEPWHGHGWQPDAPQEIVAWFENFLVVEPPTAEIEADVTDEAEVTEDASTETPLAPSDDAIEFVIEPVQ